MKEEFVRYEVPKEDVVREKVTKEDVTGELAEAVTLTLPVPEVPGGGDAM